MLSSRYKYQCIRAHDELLGHLRELPSIERAIGDSGREGALWRKHQELDATRQDLEQRLDKLLRIKRGFEPVGTPTGQQLLDEWRAAERAVAETGKAWQAALGQGETLRARRGAGDDAWAYEAHREAISRRDELRLRVVRGVRIHQLDGAERRQLELRERVASKTGHDASAGELHEAQTERLRCQALLDEVAPWQPAHLHPQPDVTAERLQAVQERFDARLRDWVAYKDEHGSGAVVDVYKGEAERSASALLDVYRRADIEYQHVQQQMQIERLETRLCSVERDYVDVHRELFGRLTTRAAVTRALTERGEEGALWKRREQLETERRGIEQEREAVLGFERPSAASKRAVDLPEGIELGRQWHAAEDALTAAAAAWSEVPEGEKARARAGFGAHEEAYRAYCSALDRRDALREPLVRGVRDDELEQATQRHVAAARMAASSPGDVRHRQTELEAKAERQLLEALLGVSKGQERTAEPEHVPRAAELEAMWQKLASARRTHPYLVMKRVPAHDLKEVEDGSLVMALRDVDGRIRSVQPAGAEDTKERIAGDPQSAGCFHLIGDIRGGKEIMVCEGYASGATLHQITRMPVAVAVDAENLQPVAEVLRERHPSARIIIAADNDHHWRVNVGVEKANEAAKAVGGAVVAPKFDPFERVARLSNWNDLYKARGIDGVKDELDRQLEPKNEKDQQRELDQGGWERTR